MDHIRVMTMNLRFGLAKDGKNCWENRKDLVAEVLSRYPADFIGFQEVNHFQAEFLQACLPEHGHIGWYNKTVPWWQSNMIFFQKSWACKGRHHQFLSLTPDIPSKLEGSKWPRQCVAGWFSKKDKELLMVNTHFDFDSKVQAKSASLALGVVERFPPGLCVAITGDFNSEPGSPAYERFRTAGFKEVFDGQSITTYHEFKGGQNGPHIDWLLYKGKLVLDQSRVVMDEFSGRFPSDHYPVYGVFLPQDKDDSQNRLDGEMLS